MRWRKSDTSAPFRARTVGCGLIPVHCKHSHEFTIGRSDAEAAAYDAPYPDVKYKAGVRRFPNLVPDRPDAAGAEISRQARSWWQNEWSGKSFMAIGAADPVLGPSVMLELRKVIRGCPEPLILKDAGHFVQEWGEQIVPAALKALG